MTMDFWPMIVTANLSKGAVAMSKKKTIVKDLNAIQNFGAMNILCTDKTGTLTCDQIVLEKYINADGSSDNDKRILRHAYFNSFFQTGLKNLMDKAILSHVKELSLEHLKDNYRKVDEIPFDFTRRRMSVVVEDNQGKRQIITKGAVEEMLEICSHAEFDGKVQAFTPSLKSKAKEISEQMNKQGMRVIAVAHKSYLDKDCCFEVKDESAADIVGSDGAIVVDSFSHCWDNEGGVLDIKSQIAQQRGKNDYTAWDEAGKIQNNLVNTILSVDCHTIITMRAKMAYAMEVNDRGKTVPVKIGLAPVQRENTEYEFDMCFQLDRTHNASLSKDTTFLDSWTGIITPELGKQLGEWLSKGVELPRCSDCGDVIMAYGKRTVKQIIDGTTKNYGRQLCMQCVAKLIKQKKQEKQREGADNATSTVSE